MYFWLHKRTHKTATKRRIRNTQKGWEVFCVILPLQSTKDDVHSIRTIEIGGRKPQTMYRYRHSMPTCIAIGVNKNSRREQANENKTRTKTYTGREACTNSHNRCTSKYRYSVIVPLLYLFNGRYE